MIGRLTSLCLLIAATTAAQQVVTPGNVTGVNIGKQSIRITTTNARAEITAWSHNVVRVRLDRQEPERTSPMRWLPRRKTLPLPLLRTRTKSGWKRIPW